MFRLVALAVVFVAFSNPPDQYSTTTTEKWIFKEGGSVRLRLRTGKVHISKNSNADEISLTYIAHSNFQGFVDSIQTHFEVGPTMAVLGFKEPEETGGDTDIELKVPSHTNIFVRLASGEIVVDPIDGSKDLETRVGNVNVSLPPAFAFKKIDVSTRIGQVKTDLGKTHGSLGKSFRARGAANDYMHIHCFVGDICISESPGLPCK